ncbi:uncharacterized protein PFL1_02043 [Pseudozyma flocculosa PF-1]|uniref:uncharacterized protein n=1 Tax=Pseudozyma flocculosa PF-1 TaxID=1277687 RepID=UPI0004560BC8|nr:uncharacterized protein PFL1_02043 [Pseudozyma flocculosa PF-1]EPQ30517.1 hypothetical protein PFL1_02043 [Pseudozyma flocculosa PF-1]
MKGSTRAVLFLGVYLSALLCSLTSAASIEHAQYLLNARQAAEHNTTVSNSPATEGTAVSSSDTVSPDSPYNAAGFWRGGPELADVNSPFHPITGNGGWEWAVERAKSWVSQMTIDEKLNLTAGLAGQGRCEGTLGRVDRFGIPELCFQDGPAGVRTSDFVTVFPPGLTTAATWNRDLIYQRAAALAEEVKGKGINVHLGPATGGPLGRGPWQGRNWEGYGPDPYLQGEAGYHTIKGTQSNGVIATAKHFLAYEQETFRQLYAADDPWTLNPQNNTRNTYSANLDDRTMHELYLWPFMNAVRAGSGAVMCVYNRINGTQGCENSKVLNTILKDELDFQGFVVTDWSAAFNTSDTYNGGSDVVMPGGNTGGYRNLVGGKNLAKALQDGTVKQERVDDGIVRLLTQYILRGQDKDWPKVNYKDGYMNTYLNGTLVNEHKNVQADHWKVAKKVAEEAITLIYNKRQGKGKGGAEAGAQGIEGRAPVGLPLAKKARVAVFGSDAGPNPYGINGCQGWLGRGSQLCPGNHTSNGTNAIGWGSGAGYFPYLIDPLAGISAKAREYGGTVESNLIDEVDEGGQNRKLVQSTASIADASLVFVQARSGEDSDRSTLALEANGDEMIKAVAAASNNTIVVVHSVGQIYMDEWFDHPNITALVFAHLPGQESGSTIAEMLYGETNPSGRMPFSILAKRDAKHYPKIINGPVDDPQVDFEEGLYIDYRQWDKLNLEPLVRFGHGISYTEFDYSDLEISQTGDDDFYPTEVPTQSGKDKHPGGSARLFQYLAKVCAKVKNVGHVSGHEVAQLYLGYPEAAEAPIKQLRGFDKLMDVAPGSTKTAEFKLTRRDFSVWSVEKQAYTIVDGTYKVWVGKSSDPKRLTLKSSITMKDGKIADMK